MAQREDLDSIYNPMLHAALAVFTDPERAGLYSNAEDVGQVLLKAATDDSSQIRYVVGEDAIGMIAERESLDDVSYVAKIRDRFGIDTCHQA